VRLVERRQLLALEVLDQLLGRLVRGLLVGIRADDARDVVQPRPLRRPPAALPGDDPEAVHARQRRDGDRVQDAVLADRVGKAGQAVFVQRTAGLFGVFDDPGQFDEAKFGRFQAGSPGAGTGHRTRCLVKCLPIITTRRTGCQTARSRLPRPMLRAIIRLKGVPVRVSFPKPSPSPVVPKVVTAREIEGALRRLRGVLSARVVCDASGAIIEIHAVAAPDRPAKMVVRDIETTLLAQWNLAPARNKISIAQMQPGASPDALRALRQARLRVVAVQVSPDGGDGAAAAPTKRAWCCVRAAATPRTPPATSPEPRGCRRMVTRTGTSCSRARHCGRSRSRRGSPKTGCASSTFRRVVLGARSRCRVARGAGRAKGRRPADRVGPDPRQRTPADPAASDRAVVAAVLDAVNRRLSALEAPAPPAAGNAS
jgi:hypothetical protein